MGLVYVAALVFGLGTILAQLVVSAGGDGDAGDAGGDAGDAGGGHDALGDAGGHDALAGHGADSHDAVEVHAGDGAAGEFVGIVLSLRFWTFGALAFGLLGVLLHYLDLAGSGLTIALAILLGLISGTVASWSFRALSRSSTGAGADATDVLGRIGRVIVPPVPGSRGKVRLELRGQTVDYVASTDETALEAGERVVVEELRDHGVHVARVPPDRQLGSG